MMLTVLGGCSSESDHPSTSVTLEEAGGTLALPGGGTLNVPDGALSGRTTLQVTAMEPPAADDWAPAGAFFRFEPAGLRFNSPVELRVPLAARGVDPDRLGLA